MTFRVPFSCHRYTPDRLKIHSKCFLGMLISLRTSLKNIQTIIVALQVIKMLNNTFYCKFLPKYPENDLSHAIFMSSVRPGRSKIHPKRILCMLLSTKNITEDSTSNEIVSRVFWWLFSAENHDFLHVANSRQVTDLVFGNLRENGRF